MAKVKINSLPPGITIKNGKIVDLMQMGGITTGDQYDFGLATTVKTPEKENTDKDINVRYSLNAVPREEANIEAEGGETVLTDLNNDGLFGLYDIKGPRHSSGGVPLNLPEQSFVFSDTKEMKLGGQDLEAFGIKTRKKMTPADVSRKYNLNTYYGAIKDQYADDIQVKSAELMMDKNKKSLSKLAFVQESKKDFEEGVPVASHPYLLSQGIDPINFTAKVERISQQKAQQKVIDSLPPDQRAQMMMLQQMLSQADASEQQMMQEPSPEEMVMDMGKYGKELPKAQFGPELNFGSNQNNISPYRPGVLPIFQNQFTMAGMPGLSFLGQPSQSAARMQQVLSPQTSQSNFLNSIYAPVQNAAPFGLPTFGTQQTQGPYRTTPGPWRPGYTPPVVTPASAVTPTSTTTTQPRTTPDNRGAKSNVAVDPAKVERYKNLGIDMDFTNVGESRYVNVQSAEGEQAAKRGQKLPGRYGDASLNETGWVSSWEGIYPETQKLIGSLATYSASPGQYKNPEVVRFQEWLNNEYIPQAVNQINADRKAAGYNELTAQEKADLTADLRGDFGFGPGTGRDFDGKFGTFTSSRRPLKYKVNPKETPQEGCPCDDGTYSEKCCEKEETKTIPPGELGKRSRRPDAEFWLQDLIQLNSIASRERDMFFPWQPAVANVDLGYVLEEPTRAIAATNERLGLQIQGAGAFGGPQALAARTAQAQAQAATEIANEVGRVNQRNVSTINQGLAQQAQMEMGLARERRDRIVKEYDDTQAVLQRYLDEKNFDREQYNIALANAVTNRANTYNLNSVQDYYQIDPSSGGMLGQFSGKAFEAAALPDPYKTIRDYAEAARMLKAAGIEPTAALIEGAMKQPVSTAQETNAYRAYMSNPNFGYGASMTQGKSKKGKEVKETIIPFYMGKIGG